MGNRKQPFGYRVVMGEIALHPQESKLVEYIFQQYLAGATYNTIVKNKSHKGAVTQAPRVLIGVPPDGGSPHMVSCRCGSLHLCSIFIPDPPKLSFAQAHLWVQQKKKWFLFGFFCSFAVFFAGKIRYNKKRKARATGRPERAPSRPK